MRICERYRMLVPSALTFGLALLVLITPALGETRTAQLADGRTLQVDYQAAEVDASFLQATIVGNFFALPEGPLLTIQGEFQGERKPLPAGLYSIGMVKQRGGGYYIALYPGDIREARRAPRLNVIIALATSSGQSFGSNAPLTIDVVETQGAARLRVQLSDISLEGQLN